jgi:hypothetical protein
MVFETALVAAKSLQVSESREPGDRQGDRNRGETSRLPATVRWPGEPNRLSRGALPVLLLLTRGDPPAIHVQSPAGEAKYWIDPNIELARNYGLSAQDLNRVEEIVTEHEGEIRDAWADHFGD